MFSNNYNYIPLNYTMAFQWHSQALPICELFVLLIQSVNGAQFLNITILFALF